MKSPPALRCLADLADVRPTSVINTLFMPTRPLSPCRKPGCPALLPKPGYCAAHAKDTPAHQYEDRRRNDESVRLRRGSNWRKVSLLVRRQQPLCVDPLNLHAGFPVPAAQVHHVESADARPDLIFSMENLASVCIKCHAEVERLHKAGKPTAHLFAGKTAGGYGAGIA
jgi:5-methylcytosine-specific restriction protein A